MSSMRLSVLVENTAGGRGLLAEHGLSFWIEAGGRRLLFDTGQTGALWGNAERMGIPLHTVDAIVLSHGHYDHTGGLEDVLALARGPRLYAHPMAFEKKYACHGDSIVREIGMSLADRRAVSERAEFVSVEQPMQLDSGLWLTGPIPRESEFEDCGGAFFKDAAGTVADDLPDDQAAFTQTPLGTIVLLGCAHAGVINTLHYIRQLTGDQTIHTVLGGMHLLNASPERMAATIEALRDLDIQRLLPCHCTGFPAMARLWSEFSGRCSHLPAGAVLDVPL